MKCRNCGAGLETEGFDHGLGVVSCSHCGGLHQLDDSHNSRSPSQTARTADQNDHPNAETPRAIATKPSHFEISQQRDHSAVSWPEGSRKTAVILGLFAFLWMGLTLSNGAFIVAPVGLVLLYIAAVRAMNRNQLSVHSDHLSFKRGPLPWLGGKTVPRSQIKQIYAREKIATNRTIEEGRERVQTRLYYTVAAKLADGNSITLIPSLRQAEQALWLEQFIEKAMGIEDDDVAGAFRG